jgi:hypothetical protein
MSSASWRVLTRSPKERSGCSSLSLGRSSFEKNIKLDMFLLGAFGSFFFLTAFFTAGVLADFEPAGGVYLAISVLYRSLSSAPCIPNPRGTVLAHAVRNKIDNQCLQCHLPFAHTVLFVHPTIPCIGKNISWPACRNEKNKSVSPEQERSIQRRDQKTYQVAE